jgi:hypothetical protein
VQKKIIEEFFMSPAAGTLLGFSRTLVHHEYYGATGVMQNNI